MPVVIGGAQWVYQNLARRVCFLFDSEPIHDASLAFGHVLGKVPGVRPLMRGLFHYADPRITTDVAGIRFGNPVGLAAGFDYEAKIPRIASGLGFGFESVGTVTLGAYGGNEYPRIKRAVRSQSILVNKGFKSRGMKAVLAELSSDHFDIPIGISIGQTNREYRDHADAVEDIVGGFRLAAESAIPFAYYELNISCPNLKTGISFYDPARFDELLAAVAALRLSKPLFVKMPIVLSDDEALALVDVAKKHAVAALIIGNLQKDREDPAFDKTEIAEFVKYRGNWGGAPCRTRSDELIRLAYRRTRGAPAIIGCGGIFTAEDAYRKIRLGASLVQLATGLIYEGPFLPAAIGVGLARLLERDGFTRLADAVGVES